MSARVRKLGLVVLVVATGILLAATVPVVHEDAKLTASDSAPGHRFGLSLSISGDTAVVGAPFNYDVGGAVYVFVSDGSTWIEQARLTGADAPITATLGRAVAISGDTLIAGVEYDDHGGGTNAGSALMFVRDGTSWTLQAKLIASDATDDDRLGAAVALSGDTAVVSAPLVDVPQPWGVQSWAGAAYVFARSGANWTEQAKLTASDARYGEFFGQDVAVSGDTAVVGRAFDNHAGGFDNGSAHVFVRNGSTWTEQAKLWASDGGDFELFGRYVGISGETIVAGSPGDSAYVFLRSGTNWAEQAKLLVDAADPYSGLRGPVAISGDTIITRGYHYPEDESSAHVFKGTGGIWSEAAKLLPASDSSPSYAMFGYSVALDGDTVTIGAYRDNDNGPGSGSAYVFRLIPPDADGDGIDDEVDVCLDTIIPESVPTNHLGVNRWALVDDDGMFDTTPPPGGGKKPDFDFMIENTGGCSCEQIIEEMALGWGHTKFGCSTGAMLQWIALIGVSDLPDAETESSKTARAGYQSLEEGGDSSSGTTSGSATGTGAERQQPKRRTPRRGSRQK